MFLICIGEDVALYFGWMQFFSGFLKYSAIVGLIMYFLRPSDASIDNDPYVPLFSVFMAVWGVLFLIVSTLHTIVDLLYALNIFAVFKQTPGSMGHLGLP